MSKSDIAARFLGPAVLFCALFLPGYIYQSAEAASTALTDPSLLIQNLVLGVPQVLLILYILLTRSHETRQAAGIVRFNVSDLLKILAGTVGLFIISIPSTLLSRGFANDMYSPVTPDAVTLEVFLLFLPVCLVTGYREELFFRSYLLTEFEPFGRKAGVAAGSILFALGHVYQGVGAFFVTALIGIFLSWLFLKTRNIHVIALSHGIYNYVVLVVGVYLIS